MLLSFLCSTHSHHHQHSHPKYRNYIHKRMSMSRRNSPPPSQQSPGCGSSPRHIQTRAVPGRSTPATMCCLRPCDALARLILAFFESKGSCWSTFDRWSCTTRPLPGPRSLFRSDAQCVQYLGANDTDRAMILALLQRQGAELAQNPPDHRPSGSSSVRNGTTWCSKTLARAADMHSPSDW